MLKLKEKQKESKYHNSSKLILWLNK
jgi:hypothetical protein